MLNIAEILILKEQVENECMSPTPVKFNNTKEEVVAMGVAIAAVESGNTHEDWVDGQLYRHSNFVNFNPKETKQITQYFITKLIEINNMGN